MKKRGTISLSFGFIFSILVIAAILGVAFYSINYFLGLGQCSEVSLFVQNFQENVDRAWVSEITKDTYVTYLPRGIESVCFWSGERDHSAEEFQIIKEYLRIDKKNMFFYPPGNACELSAHNIKHIDLADLEWHCFSEVDGEIKIKLEKDSYNPLVIVKDS